MSYGRVMVVGMGISGLSACRALARLGVKNIIAYDDKNSSELGKSIVGELESLGCKVILGNEAISKAVDCVLPGDLVILSPGVPLNAPIIVKARNKGAEIIGELEWAWGNIVSNAICVAITGTNGKTTTTEVIGEVCREHFGSDAVFVGGNIGTPLSAIISNDNSKLKVIVLEVSSFQLDTAKTFAPNIAVILNITEDHLDRYSSFDEYANSKMGLVWRAVESGGRGVLNGDDPVVCNLAPDKGCVYWIRMEKKLAEATISNGILNISLPHISPWTFDLSRLSLQGVHNYENIAAVALVAGLLKISWTDVENVLLRYRPGRHRLEWVGEWNGVDFYDDSKATNVDAVVRALESFNRPVWLLVGGRDKYGSYASLVDMAVKRCQGVVAFGEARNRICRAFRERGYAILEADDLEKAFFIALRSVRPGDIVLLSPACSSFDHYRNYAERGEHFQRLVRNLHLTEHGSAL